MNEKKKKNFDLFVALTRNKSKEEIQRKQRKYNRTLDAYDRKRIIEKNARMAKRTMATWAIRGAIGLGTIGLGVGGYYVLSSKNSSQIEQEQTSEEASSRDAFVEGLTVDLGEQDSLTQSIEEEIKALETSSEVLDYIKNIYAEEFNANNNTQITSDNISFYKYTANLHFYNDTAENGDTIIRRYTYPKPEGVKSSLVNSTMIQAQVSTEDGRIIENSTGSHGKFVNVYTSDEEVDKYVENTLSSMGSVVYNGVTWAIAMEQEDTSYTIKQNYLHDFIDAVTSYQSQKSENNIAETSYEQSSYEQDER